MHSPKQLAEHVRQFYFGGNWTWSYLKEHLDDLNWKEATSSIGSINTIAILIYHLNYYVKAVSERISQKASTATHEKSFIHPAIASNAEWKKLVEDVYATGEAFAKQIQDLSEEDLEKQLSAEHGTCYRNILGILEHNHYHLGQLVLLKKIIQKL